VRKEDEELCYPSRYVYVTLLFVMIGGIFVGMSIIQPQLNECQDRLSEWIEPCGISADKMNFDKMNFEEFDDFQIVNPKRDCELVNETVSMQFIFDGNRIMWTKGEWKTN